MTDDFYASVSVKYFVFKCAPCQFQQGYVALKDIADDTCLLKPIPFDKKEHIPGLRDYVNVKGTVMYQAHDVT